VDCFDQGALQVINNATALTVL